MTVDRTPSDNCTAGQGSADFSLICDPICFQWLTRTIFGVFGVTFSFKPAPPAAWLQADRLQPVGRTAETEALATIRASVARLAG